MRLAQWLAAASVAGLLTTTQAVAQSANVIHFYTSKGESLAIGEFAKEYNKRGGTWVDESAVGPQAEVALALSRIAGGNPPAAMQWSVGKATQEMNQQGMLTSLGGARPASIDAASFVRHTSNCVKRPRTATT